MEQIKNLIIGAGIAGLGASHALKQRGETSLVLEQDETYGGLCGNFEINGFRFDRFVHFSFSPYEDVNEIFNKSTNGDIIRHESNPFNIYKGKWIKHPAQNNLYPLEQWEKDKIVEDFKKRPTSTEHIHNYEDWLRYQFGDYFTENFPMKYTRKYWMKEAKELRTEWTGGRFYQPSIDEVIEGCNTPNTPITYYAKEMRYPAKGGFKTFFKSLADEANIRVNSKVKAIDIDAKIVMLENGDKIQYERLISSMPLPEVIDAIENAPITVKEAAGKLEATCGYHVSVALKGNHIPPYLWWYIYDEDILTARVHSPALKSSDNVPAGCTSLQMEVYCKPDQYSEKEIIDGTVGKLIALGIINEEDVIFTHLGYEKYCNVIFTEPIYESRKIVREWLASKGIETIGRFGEWDYLWSDQALLSGLKINKV